MVNSGLRVPDDDVVYVGIGNSDDKLTQAEWARFCDRAYVMCERYGSVIGCWFSVPNSEFQNACICVGQVKRVELLRKALGALAADYRQDTISFAEAVTTFIRPENYDSARSKEHAGLYR